MLTGAGSCATLGALHVLSGVKDLTSLLHGPEGCATTLSTVLHLITGEQQNVLTSSLTEMDVIYGGEEKLRKCLKEILDRKYNVACVSTCVSELIGEDIGGIVQEASQQYDIVRALFISGGGITGNYEYGVQKAYQTLFSSFQRDEKLKPTDLNILGFLPTKALSYALSKIYATLQRFQIDFSTYFYNSRLIDIKRALIGKLNIVPIQSPAIESSKEMKVKFGIPLLERYLPIGLKNTTEWFAAIFEQLNIKEGMPFLRRREHTCYAKIVKIAQTLKNRKIVIEAPSETTVALSGFIFNELDADVSVVIVENNLNQLKGYLPSTTTILQNPEFDTLKEIVVSKEADLILGSELMFPLASELGLPLLRVAPPYAPGKFSPPILGFEGSVLLANSIRMKLQTMGKEVSV